MLLKIVRIVDNKTRPHNSLPSINLHSLNARKENLIIAPGFDFYICFVQETLLSCKKSINDFSCRWRGPTFWSPAIWKQGGVAILFKEHFDGKIISWCKEACGRILSILLELANTRLNVINIYAPVNLSECKSFFENLP